MMDSGNIITIVLAVAQLALTLIAALVGWLVKGLFNSIDQLKAADADLVKVITELRVSMPDRYVNKSDYKDQLDNIFNMLREINGKMDRKVDKGQN